jgi:hypothetical protein
MATIDRTQRGAVSVECLRGDHERIVNLRRIGCDGHLGLCYCSCDCHPPADNRSMCDPEFTIR